MLRRGEHMGAMRGRRAELRETAQKSGERRDPSWEATRGFEDRPASSRLTTSESQDSLAGVIGATVKRWREERCDDGEEEEEESVEEEEEEEEQG
ncbi:unnamed protein product [Cutaneotrichosporon oleaginosum]